MEMPRNEHAMLLIVLIFVCVMISASPVAWPEEKLDAINALRAGGASEVSSAVFLLLVQARPRLGFKLLRRAE